MRVRAIGREEGGKRDREQSKEEMCKHASVAGSLSSQDGRDWARSKQRAGNSMLVSQEGNKNPTTQAFICCLPGSNTSRKLDRESEMGLLIWTFRYGKEVS